MISLNRKSRELNFYNCWNEKIWSSFGFNKINDNSTATHTIFGKKIEKNIKNLKYEMLFTLWIYLSKCSCMRNRDVKWNAQSSVCVHRMRLSQVLGSRLLCLLGRKVRRYSAASLKFTPLNESCHKLFFFSVKHFPFHWAAVYVCSGVDVYPTFLW